MRAYSLYPCRPNTDLQGLRGYICLCLLTNQ
nr:MAG TPA: hypothetical protein [Caudoviricetes sp.]